MIKLESSGKSVSALALLILTSIGDQNGIHVFSEDKAARRQVDGKWTDDNSRRVQEVAADLGDQRVELSGTVGESYAVHVNAPVYKVVLAVNIVEGQKGAFAAGQVSRAYSEVRLVQVLEVWDSPTKRLYGAETVSGKGPAKTLDATGKVVNA